MRRVLSALAVATALALVALAAWYGGRGGGQALPPGPSGGDFTLTSADGPVSLAGLRGKVVLIYFGYASCPDVCPTTFALTAHALAQLSADERAQVRVLFVSVDPARDTPQSLKQYAAHFGPQFIGVTGKPSEIAEVVLKYGAAFRITPVDSAAGYVVDHTSFTSVVAPDGRLVEQLPDGAHPDQIVQAIRRLLQR